MRQIEETLLTRPARVGVIGTGWWATSYHLPTLAAHPHAELVGVADIDPRKAEEAARLHAIPHSFDDHRSLLELGLDGVVVATSHDTHYTLARDALEAGADVLVEKPMTIEPEDARELVRLARRLQRRLHVGYPFPYTVMPGLCRGSSKRARSESCSPHRASSRRRCSLSIAASSTSPCT